jgi:hypothetical protein
MKLRLEPQDKKIVEIFNDVRKLKKEVRYKKRKILKRRKFKKEQLQKIENTKANNSNFSNLTNQHAYETNQISSIISYFSSNNLELEKNNFLNHSQNSVFNKFFEFYKFNNNFIFEFLFNFSTYHYEYDLLVLREFIDIINRNCVTDMSI